METIKSIKTLTLVLVLNEKDEKILLGMKKRGFGAGKINGFGGKVEVGETIEEGARRELVEESEIEAVDMEKIGTIMFTFENDTVGLETHVFITTGYKGTPNETEEMRPEWFDYSSIPFDRMWADDIQWFPYVLNKTKFMGHFHIAQDQKTILNQRLIQENDIEQFSFEKLSRDDTK